MKFARTLMGLLLGKRRPRTRGTIAVAGPRDQIVVSRDEWGIPHIKAQNDYDAWFGLGFCNGQDRTFQLEGLLRVGRGTLAELIGDRGVPVDRLSRRVGFHRASKLQWPVLATDIQEILNAFAAGI